MNYGQFLYMFPECALVVALIIVFAFDFAMSKSGELRGDKPNTALGRLTWFMLMSVGFAIFSVMRQEDTITAFGGMYVATQAVNVMKMILTFGTFIVVMMADSWVATRQRIAGEFYMLILSTLLGMFVMMSSGNFLLFFLGLEMASVPMACMVAFDKWKQNSAEGAAKYILTATFSSGVMLYGISFIYAAAGTLYFDDVAATITASPLAIMGLVFFFSGLGFKISLVPFHFWTAEEYLLYIVIVLSITVANLFAIRQSELKRFMAFSSISQAGYIMLAVVGNSQMGVAALTYYVLVYVAANMAVFTVINVVERQSGRTDMAAYNGFYQTNPKLSFLMTLALFSLAGIPPFAGMFSKFFVFMAAAEQGSAAAYFVVFIALVNTVVSLYYYLLIVKAMYITKTDSPMSTFKSDECTKIALGICTAGVALFGVCSCVYEWIAAAGL